ncbi:MAG: barstar family protein [Planctomycetaceae bacterium]
MQPMEYQPEFVRFDRSAKADATIRTLKDDGFTVFVIDGIDSPEAFFTYVKDNLPMDPPLSGDVNWNAFADSLWYGLDATQETHVSICWLNADQMVEARPQHFWLAIQCLDDVARNFSEDWDDPDGRHVIVRIWVFGDGALFEESEFQRT